MSGRHISRRRLIAAMGTSTALAGCVSSNLPVDKGVESDDGGSTIYVAPDGQFLNSGAEADPLGSIHRAANVADPGDTVVVQPGEYRETVEIESGGEPDAPITITGPSEAVLKPPAGKESAACRIDSSYVHLTGLTITGLLNPDAPDDPASYHADKLISLNSDASDSDDYVEGLVVSPNRLGNTGQSLINSQQIKNCDIGGFRVIGPAGTKWILDDSEGHNGEIVYLGTASDNRLERGYETYDRTRNIRVHHIDNSAGHPHSELVDCKAGTENITIEYCTSGGGTQTEEGAWTRAVSLDGIGCTVRHNIIHGVEGDGVRIGPQRFLSSFDDDGDPKVKYTLQALPKTEFERKLGKDHAIYDNVFTAYTQDAINFYRLSRRFGRESNPRPEDQRVLCGNVFDGHSDATPADSCPTDVPISGQVGHLAGESPFEGTPPTKSEVFARQANGQNLDITVEPDSVPPNTDIEVPITVSNTGSASTEVEFRLLATTYELDRASVSVPAGAQRTLELTAGGLTGPEEVFVQRNGHKIHRIKILRP